MKQMIKILSLALAAFTAGVIIALTFNQYPTISTQESFYDYKLWDVVELTSQTVFAIYIGYILQKKLHFSGKIVEIILADIEKTLELIHSLTPKINSYNTTLTTDSFNEINFTLKNARQKIESLQKKLDVFGLNKDPKMQSLFLDLRKTITGGSFGTKKNPLIPLKPAQTSISNYVQLLEDLRIKVLMKIKN